MYPTTLLQLVLVTLYWYWVDMHSQVQGQQGDELRKIYFYDGLLSTTYHLVVVSGPPLDHDFTFARTLWTLTLVRESGPKHAG